MRVFNRKGGWSEATPDGYRSGLEEGIAKQLASAGIGVLYERNTINYVIPASNHRYTPDFVLPNGIIIESKGIFDIPDRKKHRLIKEQYPNLDIRFVFSNPQQKIHKTSRTTYAAWCEKYGFLYAKKFIPAEWFKEKPHNTDGLNLKKGSKK